MRRIIATLVISVAATLGMSGLAAADGEGGDYCGASSNGCAHSFGNTICAAHGAFGAFGKGNSLAGGANGDATGYYNSILCGNPQGAAGTLGE